jgi:hypothetical protein
VSATALLVACGLLAGVLLVARLRVPGAVARAAVPSRSVSIVVPARDEEAQLPVLLGSIAASTGRTVEVVVVDDGSTDRTSEVAAAGGARVIAAPPPPPGWAGKPWACHLGAGAAEGETLVFLDADTELGAGGLDRLLAAHDRLAGDGLLSVQPHHRAERAHEQLSAYPNVVAMMASGAFVPGPGRDVRVAFGPCLLTTAQAYRRVGGHATVAGEVVEDIHLARAYRRLELPVRALAGGTAITFRMYPAGLRQLAEGWVKNLSGGARLAAPVPTVGAAAWVAATAAVAVALVEVASGAPSWSEVAWPAAGWAAVAAHLRSVLGRIGSFRWWAWAIFPVPLLAFVVLFAWSVVRRVVRRRVRWRGRDLDVAPTRP